MFTAAKVSFDFFTEPTAVGRVNYVASRSGATIRTVIDSSGNVFITQQFNTTTLYFTIIPANGSAAIGRSITGATRNVLAAAVNETGASGRTYISVGTIVAGGNTFNEAIQVLGSTGLTSGAQAVFYGTSTSIYFNNIYGAYVDTTNGIEIYMGTANTTGTKFILSASTDPATAITPTTMRSVANATGTFTIARMIVEPTDKEVIMVGNTVISSVTSALLIVGSGTGYGTYKAAGLGSTSNPAYYFTNVCVDGSNKDYIYAVGSTFNSTLGEFEAFIAKFDISGATISDLWYKAFTGTFGAGRFNSVASDSSGNVYAFGIINSSNNPGVVKFDSSGNILWARAFSSSASISDRAISVTGSTIYLVFTSGGTNTLTYSMPTDGTYSNVLINSVRVIVNPETVTTQSVTLTLINPTFTSTTLSPTNYSTAVTRTNTSATPTSRTIQTY